MKESDTNGDNSVDYSLRVDSCYDGIIAQKLSELDVLMKSVQNL